MSLFSNLYPFLIPIFLGVFIGFLFLIFYVPAENILSIEYLRKKSNYHISQNLNISFEIDKIIKIKIQNKSKYNIYIEDIDLLLFNPKKNLFINKFLVNYFNIELTPNDIHEFSIDLKPVYFEKKQSDEGLYEFLQSIKKFKLNISQHNGYYNNLSFYIIHLFKQINFHIIKFSFYYQ